VFHKKGEQSPIQQMRPDPAGAARPLQNHDNLCKVRILQHDGEQSWLVAVEDSKDFNCMNFVNIDNGCSQIY
jgi:hypothetical protein